LVTNKLINNVQWAPFYNFDLRLSKLGRFQGLDFTFFANVYNVLDIERIGFEGFADGPGAALRRDSQDFQLYMKSLHLPMYGGAEYQAAGYTAGNDRAGDKKSSKKDYINMPNRDFLAYLSPGPRFIEFGLRLGF
jgi:hypothetical protein